MKRRTLFPRLPQGLLLLALLQPAAAPAEPILALGTGRWLPGIERSGPAPGAPLKADRLNPVISLRLPTCCLWTDLSYGRYGARSDDETLALHSTALSAGLVVDPFRYVVEVGLGLEALHLRRTRSATAWGPVGVLGLSAEIAPRLGLDLRLMHRFGRRKLRLREGTYAAPGSTLSAGLAFFLRR